MFFIQAITEISESCTCNFSFSSPYCHDNQDMLHLMSTILFDTFCRDFFCFYMVYAINIDCERNYIRVFSCTTFHQDTFWFDSFFVYCSGLMMKFAGLIFSRFSLFCNLLNHCPWIKPLALKFR